MSNDVERQRWDRIVQEPFNPEPAAVEYRVANALEYIAAQLGEINRKLSAGPNKWDTL